MEDLIETIILSYAQPRELGEDLVIFQEDFENLEEKITILFRNSIELAVLKERDKILNKK